MNSFPYNLYIGSHMKEPLRVLEPTNLTTELTYKNIGFIVASSCDHAPLIRSISDLTDEELIWVFCGDSLSKYKIIRRKNSVAILCDGNTGWYSTEIYKINFLTKTSKNINQEILNRFYSLHVSLDYEELIEKDLALSYKDLKWDF